jgi:hypothetical protein
MGPRTHLPITPRTSSSPATLTPPPQHSAAAQLTPRPTTNQPRSQPM